jgi:hypothetical protein
MSRARALALAPFLLALAALPARAAPPMRGIALGLYHREADEKGYSFPAMLSEIHRVGADHVSLVVSWRQRDVRSIAIAPHAEVTIPDDRLRRLIREAKRRRLKVFLFPILELEVRRPLEWRGTLAPRDVDGWWRSYQAFILHYARLAADEKVEILSIGSELATTEAWRERWFALIALVRRTYGGALLYSANWDHYEQVSFWSRLDYVGVTAYNELSRSNDAPEAELRESWRRVKDRLVAFAKKIDKPLVITEVGWTSQDGAAVHPWDYTSRAPVDLEEQRRCYAAFVAAWDGEPALAGVFFWNWFGAGGARDTYYTPKGKPAEKVLRDWYRTR